MKCRKCGCISYWWSKKYSHEASVVEIYQQALSKLTKATAFLDEAELEKVRAASTLALAKDILARIRDARLEQ